MRITSLISVILILVVCITVAQGSEETAWSELISGKAVALIRHSLAPGIGDPPGFRLGVCSTQRNLSREGREQARRIGGHFRVKGITEAYVYSSQWCRCLETARLLGLGEVEELPSLNSFFEDTSVRETRTGDMKSFIASSPHDKPTILVTHQVNITALTGVVPSSGEIVIFRLTPDGTGRVLGRFATGGSAFR